MIVYQGAGGWLDVPESGAPGAGGVAWAGPFECRHCATRAVTAAISPAAAVRTPAIAVLFTGIPSSVGSSVPGCNMD